ncbi:MAG: hypothetical protein HYS13_15355 [Planctomycetia bacterium]|nr:hypothetical protein [Planctomycetia bacterium]
MAIEKFFPNLSQSGFSVTSPASPEYNCIAWAAEEQDRWWWPDTMGTGYWPAGAPREEKLSAFIRAFELLGYRRCDHGEPEPGFAKIALYAIGNPPTHAARQLPDGRWTSKLGAQEDIAHALDGLAGARYGDVVALLKHKAIEQ